MTRTLATMTLLGLMTSLAGPALAGEPGDAVFAERGPWQLSAEGLHWSMTVDGPKAPGFLSVTDGSVDLTQITDPSDQKPALQIMQKTDQRTRSIGPFPISGGDPVLTFFLEQTSRDMATLTGGSPFYIRNRLKDALFRGGSISRDGDVATATFTPFSDDPNAARMGGFQTLQLSFVMDKDATLPIHEMRAMTTGDQPGYDNHLVME